MSSRTPQQEAANYRRRLREVEAQRDQLAQELATTRAQLISAEVDRFTTSLIRDDGSVNIDRLRRELADHLRHTITQ